MPLDELLNVGWHIARLEIAASAQFLSNVFGDVVRPSLFGVEGDDADRIVVLARKEILNNGFQVRGFVVIGFAPGATQFFRNLPLQDKRFDRCRWGLLTASNEIYALQTPLKKNRDSGQFVSDGRN